MTSAHARTFGIATIGTVVFYGCGLPLPFLLGPMAACLAAAVSGIKLHGAGQFGFFMRTFLGVAVGASITPAFVAHLPDIALSLLFVPVFIVVIAAVGYPLLRKGFGFDHPTAWYSAMPGGLQDMLIFGEEAGGDPRALSLIHATRVVVLVSLAPIVMQWVWQIDLTAPPGQPMADIAVTQILWMIFAGLVGWKFFERIGLFGASILGPMILSTVLSLSAIIQNRPPAEIIQAAQFFIGIAVGVKYVGITRREIQTNLVAGLIYALVLGAISICFIGLIVHLDIAPMFETFLAFLPGGQAEMVVIAIIAGADLTFVVSHHIVRIIFVILLAPIIGRKVF